MIKKEQIKTMGKAQLKELVKPVSARYVTTVILLFQSNGMSPCHLLNIKK